MGGGRAAIIIRSINQLNGFQSIAKLGSSSALL